MVSSTNCIFSGPFINLSPARLSLIVAANLYNDFFRCEIVKIEFSFNVHQSFPVFIQRFIVILFHVEELGPTVEYISHSTKSFLE